jgi:hypothetical protein
MGDGRDLRPRRLTAPARRLPERARLLRGFRHRHRDRELVRVIPALVAARGVSRSNRGRLRVAKPTCQLRDWPESAPESRSKARDTLALSDPLRRPTHQKVRARRRPSARKRVPMEDVMRTWNCRGCGRSNKTAVEPDGTVKCEYCRDVKSIQPSRNRGGETPGQISRFSRGRSLSGVNPRSPVADPAPGRMP